MSNTQIDRYDDDSYLPDIPESVDADSTNDEIEVDIQRVQHEKDSPRNERTVQQAEVIELYDSNYRSGNQYINTTMADINTGSSMHSLQLSETEDFANVVASDMIPRQPPRYSTSSYLSGSPINEEVEEENTQKQVSFQAIDTDIISIECQRTHLKPTQLINKFGKLNYSSAVPSRNIEVISNAALIPRGYNLKNAISRQKKGRKQRRMMSSVYDINGRRQPQPPMKMEKSKRKTLLNLVVDNYESGDESDDEQKYLSKRIRDREEMHRQNTQQWLKDRQKRIKDNVATNSDKLNNTLVAKLFKEYLIRTHSKVPRMLKTVKVDPKVVELAKTKGPMSNKAIPPSLIKVDYRANRTQKSSHIASSGTMPVGEPKQLKIDKKRAQYAHPSGSRRLYFESLVQEGLLSPLTPETPSESVYQTLQFK